MADAGNAFDLMNPPLALSNPGGSKAFQEYPRHMHRADGSYCDAANETEKGAKLAAGWFLSREDAMKAAQATAAPVADPEHVKRGPGRPRADAA